MRILLLPRYSRKGASSRLRTLQYLPYLEEHGIHVSVGELFDDEYLELLNSRTDRSATKVARLYARRLVSLISTFKHDLIWIEKEVFPGVPALVERLLPILGSRYVVDYDDA